MLLKAELLHLAMRTQLENSRRLVAHAARPVLCDEGFWHRRYRNASLRILSRKARHLQLEPLGRAVRVRGLQTHGQSVDSSLAGSRVAVNLSGMDVSEIHRGQTLVAPQTLSAVDTIDAEINLLESAPALKHRASIHFHALTSETMASSLSIRL